MATPDLGEKIVNPTARARFDSCPPIPRLLLVCMSLLLAATTLEKMQSVPGKVWINIGLGILIFVVAIILIRKAAEMNKVLLSVIIFVVFSVVGFNWVYSRNEPKFMTPFIEPLAKFFPTAGKQAEKEKRVLPQ